jgi:hypothetical protein
MEANIENMMRLAIIDYINQEDQISLSQSSTNYQTSDDGFGLMQHAFLASTSISTSIQDSKDWHFITGRPSEQKRKKASYDESKRKKVAEVRKRGACKVCRRRKVEVCLHCPKDLHLAHFRKCKHPPATVKASSGALTGCVGSQSDTTTMPLQMKGPSSQSEIPTSSIPGNTQQGACDFISPNSLHGQLEVPALETACSGDYHEMGDWTNFDLNSDDLDTLDAGMDSVLF